MNSVHTATGDKQKILVVDDKPDHLLALRAVLQGLKVECIEAGDDNAALAATLQHDFALAIVDLQMPGMDSYQLARLMRDGPRTRNVPIIFTTAAADGDAANMRKGYAAGAVDCIVKPYEPRMLASKVGVFLQLHAANRALAERNDLLAASEERFRALVMTVPDIVYRIDGDGYFTFLNMAVKNLGYTPAELIGQHFSVLMEPQEVAAISRKTALASTLNKPSEAQSPPGLFDERRTGTRRTSGLEVHLLPHGKNHAMTGVVEFPAMKIIAAEVNCAGLYGAPRGDEHAVFLGTVGVIRDISERKVAEAELKMHRERLKVLVNEQTAELEMNNLQLNDLNASLEARVAKRTQDLKQALDDQLATQAALEVANQKLADTQFAMNSVGIGIEWINADTGRLLYSNRFAAQMLGYTEEEMLRLSVPDFDPNVPPGAFRQVTESIREAQQAKFETTHRTKDGHMLPVEVTSYHLAESPGGCALHLFCH